MTKLAVIKTGGKQYLVKENQELTVDHLNQKQNTEIPLEVLGLFDDEKKSLELGKPTLNQKAKAKLLEHFKGDKIRVARFRAKVRYRKVRGFRPSLSRIKIVKI